MINISNWKEFKISDLFITEDISNSLQVPTGAWIAKKNLIDGTTPRITVSNYDNGITGYYSDIENKDYRVFENFISVSFLGTVFYHPYKASLDMKVHCLKPINYQLNLYSALFLVSVIRQTIVYYAYADQLSSTVLADIEIKLPTTSNMQPDWAYMESFMQQIKNESEHYLNNLILAKEKKNRIDISNWGTFECNKLFECKNTGNILARDVEDGSGNTPFVTASGYNNGVSAYIDASEYEIIKGHCILVGGKTFTITYQKEDFVSNDSHNFVIRVKDYEISDLSYLYLATTIYNYFGQKYQWNDAVTKDKLLSDSLPLPIDEKGEPDWKYMEEYMSEVMDQSKPQIELLSEI